MSNSRNDKHPHIWILCGGESSESAVSLKSGEAVYASIQEDHPVTLCCLEKNEIPADLNQEKDIVLPLIHGSYGEDGCLQAALDHLGIEYAGSDMCSSVVAFDKFFSKTIAERAGIPTTRDLLINSEDLLNPIDFDLPGDCFVCKPRRQGSSIGVFVANRGSVPDESNIQKNSAYVVEPFINGVDLTVGILDGEAMGVVGIKPLEGFYDYANKYTSGKTIYDTPAQIPSELEMKLKYWSKQIFELIGCRDFARVDFRLADSGEIYFLEINTIPGLTETSLLPKSASIYHYNFKQLIAKMIEPCLNRFNQKYSYEETI